MTTHTFSVLPVTQSAFDEIKAKLNEAGYDHAVIGGGKGSPITIDMSGIGLEVEKEIEPEFPTIKESITLDEAIELLSEAGRLDPIAMAALIDNRVGCNEFLVDHPTIQVVEDDGKYYVGLLGVINGLFGIDEKGNGAIAAVFDVECPAELKGDILQSNHAIQPDARIGDECPTCGNKLVRGMLIGFRRTPS